jgi:hypothetical protein
MHPSRNVKHIYHVSSVLVILPPLLSKVFSPKTATSARDVSSRETAISFPKARTALEAIEFSQLFIADRGYGPCPRTTGGINGGFIYDVYSTQDGPLWFKVPIAVR